MHICSDTRDITILSIGVVKRWNSGFSSSDDEDLSSDGLVGDSASEASGSGSDDEGDLDNPNLDTVEASHVKKQTLNSETAEFSDPEYGYDSEDSENEVRPLLFLLIYSTLPLQVYF